MKKQNQQSIDEALDNAITALGQCQKGTARQFLQSAIDADRIARPQPHFNQQVKDYIDNRFGIGAATAEVKKEELATIDAQREETGERANVTERIQNTNVSERLHRQLLPCPFCGGEAELKKHLLDVTNRDFFTVTCTNNKCPQGRHWLAYSEKQARESWNKRSASQSTLPQAPTDSRREMKPGNHDMNAKGEHCPEQPLSASCSAAPSRKQEGEEKPERRRCECCGEMVAFGGKKAAELLGEIEQGSGEPGVAARVEPTKDAERLDRLAELVKDADTKGVTIGNGCYCSINVGSKRISEGDDLREAIDASCAVKEEEKDLG